MYFLFQSAYNQVLHLKWIDLLEAQNKGTVYATRWNRWNTYLTSPIISVGTIAVDVPSPYRNTTSSSHVACLSVS